MTIIYIMNSRLDEKLLRLKAKKYVNNLHGVADISMNMESDFTFDWHKKCLSKIWRDEEVPNYKLPISTEKDTVIKYFVNNIKISANVIAYILFEGRLIISFLIFDFESLLSSNMEWIKTYDISLLFLNPNRVIAINENEYDLTIFDIIDSK